MILSTLTALWFYKSLFYLMVLDSTSGQIQSHQVLSRLFSYLPCCVHSSLFWWSISHLSFGVMLPFGREYFCLNTVVIISSPNDSNQFVKGCAKDVPSAFHTQHRLNWNSIDHPRLPAPEKLVAELPGQDPYTPLVRGSCRLRDVWVSPLPPLFC